MALGELKHKFYSFFIRSGFPPALSLSCAACALSALILFVLNCYTGSGVLVFRPEFKVSQYWRFMVPCFDGHIRPPETYISKFKFSKLTLLQHMYKYAQVYGWKFALQTQVYCSPLKDSGTGILPQNKSMSQGLQSAEIRKKKKWNFCNNVPFLAY